MIFSEHIKAFLAGAVQGLTEFLPVSSSGHLVLLNRFFIDFGPGTDLLFMLTLHLGSLMAILSFYKKDILKMLKCFFKTPFDFSSPGRLVYLAGLATLPGALTAFLWGSKMEKSFSSFPVEGGFILTGVLLLSSFWTLNRKEDALRRLSFTSAFFIGTAQALAFFPGMSRSAWTIVTALFLGWPKKQAVFFSFLLAIPAIIGGFLWQGLKQWDSLQQDPAGIFSLSLAFFSSWLFGYTALKWLIRSLQNVFFPFFALYLLPLGIFLMFIP